MDDLTYPDDLGDSPQSTSGAGEPDGALSEPGPHEDPMSAIAPDDSAFAGEDSDDSGRRDTQRLARSSDGRVLDEVPATGDLDDIDELDDFDEDEDEDDRPAGALKGAEQPAPSAGRDINTAGETMEVVHGDKTIIHGAVRFGATGGEEPKFEPVPSQTLRDLEGVFVPPPCFDEVVSEVLRARDGRPQTRVVLVHGPDHSGKWTCAVNFALHVLARDGNLRDILQYSRPLDSELTLRDAFGSDQFQNHGQNSIVLLRDSFDRRVRREELEPAQVQDLSELLLDNNSILVLTGDVPGGHLASLDVVKLPAQVTDLQKVLRANLVYQVDHAGLPLTHSQLDSILDGHAWRDLRHFLATPFHIHQFCSRLGALTSKIEDESMLMQDVRRLAREISIGGREAARAWFDGLHANEKLLALLVYVFPGAERWWLEELERSMIEGFKADGLEWFSDLREHGLVDARSRIHAIEQGGRLEFDDRSYVAEARRQVENRQHLLWDAVEPLLALEPADEWVEAWRRQALGVALGRVGLYDLKRLLPALEDLASSQSRQRAVIPGYAFQELVRQDPAIGALHAFRTLRKWIVSANHRLMWASGAALWRVYLAAQDSDEADKMETTEHQALSLLRLLGKKLDTLKPGKGASEKAVRVWRSTFRCTCDAMRRIALADPKRAAAELRDWFRDYDPNLVRLARRGVRLIHESLALQKLRPTEEQCLAFLGLVPSLLKVASDESRDAQTVFLVLRAWLRWDSFHGLIHGELLYLATFAEKDVRTKLRAAMTRLWLDPEPAAALRIAGKVIRSNTRGPSKSEAHLRRAAEKVVAFFCQETEVEARGIAQAVIARCLAMDGRLPTLPSIGTAVAVFDPALLLPPPASDEASASAVWTLLSALESRLDLAFLPLGNTGPVQLFDGPRSIADAIPRFPGHRLVVPGLENVPTTHSRKVYVVAPHEPHDLLDLAGHPDLDSLHFIGPLKSSEQDGSTQADGVTYLGLSWPPTPPELEATLSALEIEWARGLVSAPADHLRELTRTFDVESVDFSTDMARLEALARELDLPRASSDPHHDRVWRIVAYAVWAAATDLPTCLGWISGWLATEEQNPAARARRAIAQAASSALIGLYTAYPPDPSGVGRAPTLLFDLLAEPLAQQGADGVDTILRLVGHWLEDSLWTAHLAGDVRDGRGRLERWAVTYLEDRPQLVSELAERLEVCGSTSGIDQSWEALRAVVERVRALAALSRPQALPMIAADQRYALVVLDSSAGDRDSRERLATVAADVYGALTTLGHPSGELAGGHPPGRLVPALFRLGDIRPLWATSEVLPTAERLLSHDMRPLCLIGPLLEALKEKRQQIAAVLLISSSLPLDLEDWRLSSWWDALTIYGAGAPLSAPGFKVLPKPLPLTEAYDEEDETQSEAATIAAYLEHTGIGGLAGAEPSPARASGASS